MIVNYDGDCPSKARGYSENEVHDLAEKHSLKATYFHIEETSYPGQLKYE